VPSGDLRDDLVPAVCERNKDTMNDSSDSRKYSTEDVLNNIATMFRGEVIETEEGLKFQSTRLSIKIDFAELDKAVQESLQFQILDWPSVVTPTSVEVLVQGTSPRWAPFSSRGGLVLIDDLNGLEYRFGTSTAAYTIFILMQSFENLDPRVRMRAVDWSRFRARKESDGEGEDLDIIAMLQHALRLETLQIRSNKVLKSLLWKPYIDSFFFHVGYNLDWAMIPQRNLDEVFRSSRILKTRRGPSGEIDAPRRHYISDLVYHYQLGVSTESPMLAFISYYHVVEHWFEQVYQENLTDKVQKHLTSPSFSYKRKKDVAALIKLIGRSIKQRDDELVFSEESALKLTLDKYLNLSKLATDLDSFDPTLVPAYASDCVDFADGKVVDLKSNDETVVIKELSARMYKIRNAIVHSKDGSKVKFVPFEHDRILEREVPLMRFIAEQIIIESSIMP